MVESILLAVFVVVALLYLGVPLLILRTQRIPARVKFESLDHERFLAGRDEAFNLLDGQLKSLGFSYVGSSSMSDSHSETFFSLYDSNPEKTAAMIVTIRGGATKTTYLEFSQLYSDGTMLDVSNAAQVPVYPRLELKIAPRFPGVREPGELYAVFRKLRGSLDNTAHAIAYDSANGFNDVEKYIEMESDELAKLGYCHQEIDDEGKRALTLKGAYLFTWISLFPGNRVRAMRDSAYSARLLRNAERRATA